MGQQQSSIQDEIKNKYTIIKTISPGEYLVKGKRKGAELQLRVLNFLVEDQMVHYTNLLQKRKKIKNPHLLELIEYSKVVDQLMCSSTFKLKIVSELPFKTIKEDIRERAASNSRKYFAEDELWSILYSCCHALYSLYINKFSHESLTSDQIYIDTEGIIKVADSLLVNGTKNYLSLMNEELKTENIRYISPELRNLVDDNNFYQYEKEKSDVYILGMIILEISNLAPLKYYDIKTKRFQFDIIQSAFDDFKTRYSLKLYEIVNKMLTPDYNVRPTFEEIIENIEQKTIHTNSNISSKESTIIHEMKEHSSKSSFNKPQGLNQVKEKLDFDAKAANSAPMNLPLFNFNNKSETSNNNYTSMPVVPNFKTFGNYNPPQILNKPYDLPGAIKENVSKPFEWKFDTISKEPKKEHEINYTPYQQLINLSGNATFPSNQMMGKEPISLIPQYPIFNLNLNNQNEHLSEINPSNLMKERRFSQLKFGGIELGAIQSASVQVTQKKEVFPFEKQASFTEVKGNQLFKKDKQDEEAIIEKGTFVIEENMSGRYEGFKQNGQKNGIGRIAYSDGGSYEGQWKNDRMDGYGKLYYPNGKTAYQGYWLEDEFNGTGRVYNEIEENQVNSDAKISYLNFHDIEDKWVFYEGEFLRDLRHGKGMIKFITGEKFYGTFKSDTIDGEGAFYKKDGDVIQGTWRNNIFENM